MSSRLNQYYLQALPSSVKQPHYQPEAHQASIVHIGIGAFHKAHQAVYTDDLLNSVGGDWRIVAVSLRSSTNRDQLEPQDNLYTVVEKNDTQMTHRVIAAIEKVMVAPENPDAVIEQLASENTKVVTSTITEKGYCLTPDNRQLNVKHPDILHDLENDSQPKTMAGFLVAACRVRRDKGLGGFTFLSCDNLPENGDTSGIAICQFAELLDSELAAWIKDNVSFCNTMVDRIVPAVTADDVSALKDQFGYIDEAMVSCEPFKQWVIEDNFIAERPPWDRVGAQFVNNVHEYEKMKLRLLNGSHSALAYLGTLQDLDFIYQAVSDSSLGRFIDLLMDDMASTLKPVSGVDLGSYKATIKARFANSTIPHKTQQVATDGSLKLPQRIFDPLLELAQQGTISKPLCLTIAAWLRYLQGTTQSGQTYLVNDPLSQPLTEIAQSTTLSAKEKLQKIAEDTGVIPTAIVENDNITNTICAYLEELNQLSVSSILDELI
jgi:fructuronate reductase